MLPNVNIKGDTEITATFTTVTTSFQLNSGPTYHDQGLNGMKLGKTK